MLFSSRAIGRRPPLGVLDLLADDERLMLGIAVQDIQDLESR